jgi:DNA-binding MarR family transcriptional regulator
MGALVDYAEERGYVERAPDPRDGRAWLVRLTPRGRDVERVARSAIAELEDERADALGKERFAALRVTLQDLVAVIEWRGVRASADDHSSSDSHWDSSDRP